MALSFTSVSSVHKPKNIITSSGVFSKARKKTLSENGEKIRTYTFFNPENESMESSIEKAKAAISSEIMLKNRVITFSLDDLGALLEDTPSLIRNGNTLSLNEPTWTQVHFILNQRSLKQDSLINKPYSLINKRDTELAQLTAESAQREAGKAELNVAFKEVEKEILTPSLPNPFPILKSWFTSFRSFFTGTCKFFFCKQTYQVLFHRAYNFFRRSPVQ